MSTATFPATTTPLAPADPGPYRMTVDEFERIADSLDRRVELVDGTLMERPEMSAPHVLLIARLRSRLERTIPQGWHVREEKAIRIPDYNARLPDVSVVRGHFEDYPTQHPSPKDAALLVEVALTSIGRDQGLKLALYGSQGVPVYWIVNVKAHQIEVYTGPGADGYSARLAYKPGESVPVLIDGAEVGRIAVSDILPPPDPPAGGDGA
jgi:Uma2 family endonuclease